jgi:hypothetical protein
MKRTIGLLLLGSVAMGLICGCDTTPEVIYVPQPSHTGRDVGITLAVVGAGVGLTLLAVHGRHIVKGCVSGEPGSLSLGTDDAQRFTLVGAPASMHAGELLKLKGHKGAKDKSGHRNFLIDGVAKDYGPCKSASATP